METEETDKVKRTKPGNKTEVRNIFLWDITGRSPLGRLEFDCADKDIIEGETIIFTQSGERCYREEDRADLYIMSESSPVMTIRKVAEGEITQIEKRGLETFYHFKAYRTKGLEQEANSGAQQAA